MEIVYDENYNVRFRLDDGREVTLAALLENQERFEKLETALTLARNSREWNRRRVVELEDTLERQARGERLFTSAEVGDLQASEAELVSAPLKAENQRLARQVCEFDRDRRTERDRADRAQARVAELERALAASIDRENRLETTAAETAAEHRRSLAARDHLLSAATTRINAVREILLATPVSRARDEIVTSKGAVLADAIGNALHALEG